jgi:hypothetical protein
MAELKSTSITGCFLMGTVANTGSTGNLWYNTTTNRLQYSYASATAWSTGGALSTSRYSLAGAGTNLVINLHASQYSGGSWSALTGSKTVHLFISIV